MAFGVEATRNDISFLQTASEFLANLEYYIIGLITGYSKLRRFLICS
jgi:hypothetical protein